MSSITDRISLEYRIQTNFHFFCEEVLGYKADERLHYYPLTPTHRELCGFLQSPWPSKMVLMPRYSFKSAICTAGYSLWRLVKESNLRILIYSDAANKAQGFLQDIKNHIEGRAPNSRFRELYPNWETQSGTKGRHGEGKWSDDQIIVSAREFAIREPSVDTGGIESTKVGKHYDLILFDDIVSDLNTTTKDQMNKVHDCYRKALSLLRPGGEVILVGTRWHYGDCYGRIIAENGDKKNFKLFIKDAEELGKDRKLIFSSIGLTREFLNAQRSEQGSTIYSCLYRNQPCDEETAIFARNKFNFYTPSKDFHKNLYITGTCDPAGEGEDFTAITVIGTTDRKRMYILDAINDHLKPSQIIDKIVQLNYKWGFDKFAVERNYFKGFLEKEFRAREEDHRKNPFWKAFSFEENIISNMGSRNHTRVMSLQPYHERGDILFPNLTSNWEVNTLSRVYAELAFQMMQFTIDGSKSPHDDLLISLAMHVEIIRSGGVVQDSKPPERSAAWLEDQFFEQLSSSRVPSKYKQRFQRVFS